MAWLYPLDVSPGAGLRRRLSALDILRVQDVGLIGAEDPEVLACAAQEDRILLTHDVATLLDFAYERIVADVAMPEPSRSRRVQGV